MTALSRSPRLTAAEKRWAPRTCAVDSANGVFLKW
jgi:hypothetical protein